MDDNKDMEIRDITRLIEETVDAAVVKDAAKKEAGCDTAAAAAERPALWILRIRALTG